MPEVRDIREYKRALRDKCKREREKLSLKRKQELDTAIAQRLLRCRSYKNVGTLLIYMSKGVEISTSYILEDAFSSGKRVAVPYCRTDVTDLDFYYISLVDMLSPGAFGVLEPDPLKCEKFEDYDGGLCIVPALCYDINGYRLGFGKGYFDRFLSRYSGMTAGLAYSFQVKRSLWHGRYDRAVDMIITDKYLKSCGQTEGKKPCRKSGQGIM